MNSYAGLGALVVVAGGMAGLVWFANRSGKNSANVQASQANADAATDAARKVEAMAHAQANAPSSLDEITERLAEGTA